jgi:hypothetical protein
MLRRLLIGAGLLLAAAPSAHAAVKWELTPAGDPRGAIDEISFASDWWTCPPAEQCRKAAVANAFEPGASARGTFFEVDYMDYDSSDWSSYRRSPMWLGRVTARNHPRVIGSLRAGQSVGPVGALWSGGWADDVTTTVMVACPASARAQCEYLTGPHGEVTGTGPRRLQEKHVGWSVYAVQYRERAARVVAAGVAPRPVASALVGVSKRHGPVRRARSAT